MERGNELAGGVALPQAAADVYATFYRVFANRPDPHDFERVAGLAQILGTEPPVPGAVTEADFEARMLLPMSPRYVPPYESAVVAARRDGDAWRWGALHGEPTRRSAHCYKALCFDWKSLPGDRVLTSTMAADHLVVQLAFMAHLRELEQEALDGGERSKAVDIGALAGEFLSWHLLKWLPTYAGAVRQAGDDAYAAAAEALVAWALLDEVGDRTGAR